MTDPASRPVKVILGDALDELRAREQRLEGFEREIVDVRKAIKVLAKAIGEGAHPNPTAQNPAGETKRAILETLRTSLDGLTMEQIASAIGREPAGWLSMQLKRMVGSGALVLLPGGRYGLPARVEEDAA